MHGFFGSSGCLWMGLYSRGSRSSAASMEEHNRLHDFLKSRSIVRGVHFRHRSLMVLVSPAEELALTCRHVQCFGRMETSAVSYRIHIINIHPHRFSGIRRLETCGQSMDPDWVSNDRTFVGIRPATSSAPFYRPGCRAPGSVTYLLSRAG